MRTWETWGEGEKAGKGEGSEKRGMTGEIEYNVGYNMHVTQFPFILLWIVRVHADPAAYVTTSAMSSLVTFLLFLEKHLLCEFLYHPSSRVFCVSKFSQGASFSLIFPNHFCLFIFHLFPSWQIARSRCPRPPPVQSPDREGLREKSKSEICKWWNRCSLPGACFLSFLQGTSRPTLLVLLGWVRH